MAGEQIYSLELASCICTDCAHETEGISDGGDDARIFSLQLRITNVPKAPIKRTMEISDAGGNRATNEVEGACRMEVGTWRGWKLADAG